MEFGQRILRQLLEAPFHNYKGFAQFVIGKDSSGQEEAHACGLVTAVIQYQA